MPDKRRPHNRWLALSGGFKWMAGQGLPVTKKGRPCSSGRALKNSLRKSSLWARGTSHQDMPNMCGAETALSSESPQNKLTCRWTHMSRHSTSLANLRCS